VKGDRPSPVEHDQPLNPRIADQYIGSGPDDTAGNPELPGQDYGPTQLIDAAGYREQICWTANAQGGMSG
jgi:hypothetical protein